MSCELTRKRNVFGVSQTPHSPTLSQWAHEEEITLPLECTPLPSPFVCAPFSSSPLLLPPPVSSRLMCETVPCAARVKAQEERRVSRERQQARRKRDETRRRPARPHRHERQGKRSGEKDTRARQGSRHAIDDTTQERGEEGRVVYTAGVVVASHGAYSRSPNRPPLSESVVCASLSQPLHTAPHHLTATDAPAAHSRHPRASAIVRAIAACRVCQLPVVVCRLHRPTGDCERVRLTVPGTRPLKLAEASSTHALTLNTLCTRDIDPNRVRLLFPFVGVRRCLLCATPNRTR